MLYRPLLHSDALSEASSSFMFNSISNYFQEHVIIFIVTLLSPPAPADLSGSYSHLISSAPFLNVLLVGISPIDCVQIFSLHGVVGFVDLNLFSAR